MKQRIKKLPIGQQNVLLTKIKTGYADGAKRPVKLQHRPLKGDNVIQFNAPKLILRKAA